jgi:hypothetical protein
MVTATSSRRQGTAFGVIAAAAAAITMAGCQSSPAAAGPAGSSGSGRKVPPVRGLTARRAPAGWPIATLLGGKAVLAYPPLMRKVRSDTGAVSVAQFTRSGAYMKYLNATPRQGAETLADWPRYRIGHLTSEDASSARLIAESRGVKFLGGTGTCVIDAYVTKIKSHHYTELACYVRGPRTASVIVAAAPTADWSRQAAVLMRAVAAYKVR